MAILCGLLLAAALATQGSSPASMRDPLVVDAGIAEHYIWGGSNDGWYLLKRDDVQIIQERIVPGGRETLHLHRKSRQAFLVLSGSLTMVLDGVVHHVGPNQMIEVAPGTPHQTFNETQTPVQMVVFSMPPSHGDRIDLPELP